jgi:hypothetical protein
MHSCQKIHSWRLLACTCCDHVFVTIHNSRVIMFLSQFTCVEDRPNMSLDLCTNIKACVCLCVCVYVRLTTEWSNMKTLINFSQHREYVNINVYIYIYMYTYIKTFIIYIPVCMPIYIYIYGRMDAYIYIYIYIRVLVHICEFWYFLCVYVVEHIYIYIHT